MITENQCKAARAMLGWTIDDLAQKADLSRNTIILFEKGAHKTKQITINSIIEAFDSADIEFLGTEGVNKKADSVDLLVGENALQALWSNILNSLPNGGEVLITNVDEKRALDADQGNLKQHLKNLKQQNITERLLSCEGDSHFLMPQDCYRWLPKDVFDMGTSTYIYADKVALQLWGNKMIVLIHSREAHAAERKRFEYMWNKAKIPK